MILLTGYIFIMMFKKQFFRKAMLDWRLELCCDYRGKKLWLPSLKGVPMMDKPRFFWCLLEGLEEYEKDKVLYEEALDLAANLEAKKWPIIFIMLLAPFQAYLIFNSGLYEIQNYF